MQSKWTYLIRNLIFVLVFHELYGNGLFNTSGPSEIIPLTPNKYGYGNLSCEINSTTKPNLLVLLDKAGKWVAQIRIAESNPNLSCTPYLRDLEWYNPCKDVAMEKSLVVFANNSIYILLDFSLMCPSLNGAIFQCLQKYPNDVDVPPDLPGKLYQIRCPIEPKPTAPTSVVTSKPNRTNPTTVCEGKNCSTNSPGEPINCKDEIGWKTPFIVIIILVSLFVVIVIVIIYKARRNNNNIRLPAFLRSREREERNGDIPFNHLEAGATTFNRRRPISRNLVHD